MAMSRRKSEMQGDFWIAVQEIVKSPGHPFYERLNALLAEAGFDRFVEDRCQPFYAAVLGRPSIEPGVYFRMLLVGYCEGLDSERGIAWRCADSLALRSFLGYPLTKATPDHSSLSKIRQRIDLESHEAVFAWVLKVLATHDLLKGKTLGIDATTLEANAALRSIVRRDTGESYRAFLEGLARASGIETPTQADLAKLDRKRPKKGSNKDWKHPYDPDAKIAKMKDGRTHLAHKAEHAVDLDTGAIVAVTLQEADQGDTTTVYETVVEAGENLREVADDPEASEALADGFLKEAVADKGYHSNETLRDFAEMGIRTYVSEPERKGQRHWKGKPEEQVAVYGNRRRIRGKRGKALMRTRGELLERPFAHCYETGGMRRTHLKGHAKIRKRLLIHVAGFNLALVMRTLLGAGTPRGLADLSAALSPLVHKLVSLHHAVFTLADGLWWLLTGSVRRSVVRGPSSHPLPAAA
jgi:transposase